MSTEKRVLITSALPYANGPLHIGHLAGAYLPADVYARYLRAQGREVLFVCGSDEHGAAITMRAIKDGVTPREIIDKYHAMFVKTFAGVQLSFDIFHRTSEPIHHETSQDFFRQLYRDGQFVETESEQYFDPEKEQFLADRYVMGTCPVCANPDAYGDQCEKCGSTLSPTDLIEPRSTLSGAAPVLKTTRHWYLPLDRYEGFLRQYIENGLVNGAPHHNPADWKAHVIGQCKSWLDQGLQPRAMTRDLDWGVDVPHDIVGHEGKKLYVWMDAPIGYISATKQWCLDNGQDWLRWWKVTDTELLHFIGKDNIVFHCLTFPAMLQVHGGFNLPVNVPANQFLNLEGRKISTSRNWAIWVHEFVEQHADLVDSLRHYMIKIMPEQRDSEFTWKGFQETHNTDLVNNLGNFIQRVLVLTHKYYGGTVPATAHDQLMTSPLDAAQQVKSSENIALIAGLIQEIGDAIARFELRLAQQKVLELSSLGNQLLQFNEPWKRQSDQPEMVAAVMHGAVQVAAALSVVLHPFIPGAAQRLRGFLRLADDAELPQWADAVETLSQGYSLVPSGHVLGQPEHLFSRLPDEWVTTELEKLQAMEAENTPATPETPAVAPVFAPVGAEIVYDDFAKIDLRVGKIIAAEKVPKADKLLALQVDLGFEVRSIVSGIALHFEPEAIIGQQVVVVANLAPRKLRGYDSNGMILMAEDAEGKLMFVAPSEACPEGATVR
jgi:methionyl-tRNA synthetase